MKLPVVFRIISILFLVFIQQSLLIAQVDGDEGYLTASLKITDEKKNPISSVKIIFTDLNTNQVEYKSTVNGKVKIKLRLDRNYLIIASDPLYYTKTVEIRTEIKKLGYRTAFYSDIDISLLLNCENDPSRSNILGEPVGRVIYDNYKQKFVYDTRYTETKASLYMAEYYKRCEEVEKEKALALAAEKQKLELLKQSELTEKQRLEEEKRKRKEAEKKANEEEQTRIAAENEKQKQLEKEEKARLKAEEEQQKKLAEEERIRKEAEETARIKAENDKRIRQEAEEAARIKAENDKRIRQEAEEAARIKAENDKRIRQEAEEAARVKAENDKRIRQEAEEAARIKAEELARKKAEALAVAEKKLKEGKDQKKPPDFIRPKTKIKQEIFDQSKEFIYLESKNSWPSELRNYILDTNYNAKAIGTYAYTQQEAKKEFYIEDVPELREKFSKEFKIAFDNWDYIVETYSKYREENK